jgi:hypothetical protein
MDAFPADGDDAAGEGLDARDLPPVVACVTQGLSVLPNNKIPEKRENINICYNQ